MYSNFNVFVNIQVVNGVAYIATLDKTHVLSGILRDFEVVKTDTLTAVTATLDTYHNANILFILEQKELEKIAAIRQTPLASDLDARIRKYDGVVEFVTDWSLVGYRVFGDTSQLKQEQRISFIHGKNDELSLEVSYPFANGAYTVINGGKDVGYLALAKIGRDFEDGSFGYTTVADVLLKGHKTTYDYSVQCELAKLCLENYLRANGETEVLEAYKNMIA